MDSNLKSEQPGYISVAVGVPGAEIQTLASFSPWHPPILAANPEIVRELNHPPVQILDELQAYVDELERAGGREP